MKNRYLVTGATGFVGSNIVRELVRRNMPVSILVRKKDLNWRLHDISEKIDVHECNLLDPALEKIISSLKPSIIFHLAAYGAMPSEKDVGKMIEVNYMGTMNLVNAVKKYGFKLFVNTGSSSEYGIKSRAMVETDILEPINDYGVTKAAATMACRKISCLEALPIVTYRLFSPYGYYEDSNRFIPYVVTHSLTNQPLDLSDPNYVRDFIFIDDVIRAYCDAIDTRFSYGTIINIGSGSQVSLNDIVQTSIDITGSTSKINWYSKPKQNRQIEPKHWKADINNAKKLLGWEPKIDLERGLRLMVNWLKSNTKSYLNNGI
ncbi:NAD-dependent epimerase/dehydratase family protein [Candidatus Gottesmanbacteria bacterium]|nr:NAD-dependent epimerase/dehydratase family protein [Candidatus Gottesmanbacteria bacterium]